jgi:hypothetical protein
LKKSFREFLKDDRSHLEPNKLTKMSSKNNRWENDYVFVTLTPLIEPFERASLIILLRASTFSKKRKGERGKSCQRP